MNSAAYQLLKIWHYKIPMSKLRHVYIFNHRFGNIKHYCDFDIAGSKLSGLKNTRKTGVCDFSQDNCFTRV